MLGLFGVLLRNCFPAQLSQPLREGWGGFAARLETAGWKQDAGLLEPFPVVGAPRAWENPGDRFISEPSLVTF